MTKDEAVSLKNPAKVRWDIFLHATTMCSKNNIFLYFIRLSISSQSGCTECSALMNC